MSLACPLCKSRAELQPASESIRALARCGGRYWSPGDEIQKACPMSERWMDLEVWEALPRRTEDEYKQAFTHGCRAMKILVLNLRDATVSVVTSQPVVDPGGGWIVAAKSNAEIQAINPADVVLS